MKFAKFKWERLAAALLIGLVLEALLIAAGWVVADTVPAGNRIANVTQVPAILLVWLLASMRPPGFEEQSAYVLLVPLLQWLFCSCVVYLVLARRDRLRGKEAS